MTEQEIEKLAVEHANKHYISHSDEWHVSIDSFRNGAAAIKEQVTWDEAFDQYAGDESFHSNFVSWLSQNFTLIKK